MPTYSPVEKPRNLESVQHILNGLYDINASSGIHFFDEQKADLYYEYPEITQDIKDRRRQYESVADPRFFDEDGYIVMSEWLDGQFGPHDRFRESPQKLYRFLSPPYPTEVLIGLSDSLRSNFHPPIYLIRMIDDSYRLTKRPLFKIEAETFSYLYPFRRSQKMFEQLGLGWPSEVDMELWNLGLVSDLPLKEEDLTRISRLLVTG